MPVIQEGTVNLASLAVNDVYVVVARPASTTVNGVETGIIGLVGGGSWGPLNTPQKVGSPKEAAALWGPLTLNPNDLMTDMSFAFQQGITAAVGVRVADGTEASANGNFVVAAAGTVTVAGVPAAGNTITVTLAGVGFTYTLVAGDNTANAAAASLAAFLNADAAFAASYFATVAAAVVTIHSKSASNTTTFAASDTGAVTATASGATLLGGGGTIVTLSALYSGTEGNNIRMQLAPGANSTAAARTWTLQLSKTGVAPVSEVFANLPETGLAAAIIAALANGQSVTRGPSVLARASGVGTGIPAQSSVSMTGGLNGDTGITDSQQLGSNAAIPQTGMWAMEGQGVQQFGLCGNTASATWASQLAFAKQVGALAVLCLPPTLTSAAAIALKKASGIDDPYACFVKDWVQLLDTQNDQLRLLSPLPIALGRIAALTPERSPGNKPVAAVLGTERTLALSPYGPTELGDLHRAGIMVITNPVPAGAFFGLRHGLNSSSDNAVNGVEYTRMTNFIAYSLNQSFGEFIDENQSAQPGDPTRAKAETKLTNFLSKLKKAPTRFIDHYSVDMSFGPGKINTAQSVAEGFLYAKVCVKYLGVIRFFVITMIGGKTVDVAVS